MKNQTKKSFIAASVLAVAGYVGPAMAYYSGQATLDVAGNNAKAADLAVVNCYDDGHGAPHHLAAAVQDLSPPSPGLLVNLQLFKSPQITTVTDTVSADGNYSPIATLNGGPGNYYLSIHKTNAGARNFLVGWECQTVDNVGTGTNISVLQFQ